MQSEFTAMHGAMYDLKQKLLQLRILKINKYIIKMAYQTRIEITKKLYMKKKIKK